MSSAKRLSVCPRADVRIAGSENGGDLVDQFQDPVGVGVFGGVATASDLVEQGGGGAAVLWVVAVLDRQVVAYQLFDSFAVGALGAVAGELLV